MDFEGNVVASYDANPELGSGILCYNPPDFTFITTKDKKLAILQAEPK